MGAYFKGGKIVGGGSDGDTDTFLTQTFDNASLTDFVHTGLILEAASPISGTTSAKLVHQIGVSQSFKQTKEVSEKFRNNSMTVAITTKSGAALGNVTILFRDETNNADLQSTQQIMATSTVQGFQYGVKIPYNCSSFSYTITALPQSGSPVTYIDDVTIRSYWVGSAVQGQTEYQIEKRVTQSFHGSGNGVASSGTNPRFTTLSIVNNNTLLSYLDSTTSGVSFTALKNCTVNVNWGGMYISSSSTFSIAVNGVAVGTTGAVNSAGSNSRVNISTNVEMFAGQILTFNGGSGFINDTSAVLTLTAESVNLQNIDTVDIVPSKSMIGNASIEVPIITEWLNAGPTTITATTTNPVKGTTVLDKTWWRRNGDTMEVRVEYNQSAAGTAGSGDYLLSLPQGYEIDVTKLTLDNVVESSGPFTIHNNLGSVSMTSGTSISVGTVSAYDSTKIRASNLYSDAASANGIGVWSSAWYNLTNADLCITMEFRVPVKGWSITEAKTWSATQSVVTEDKDTYLRITGFTPAYGTTATRILTLTSGSIQQSVGDAIQYLDDAVSGARFIAKKEGLYRFGFSCDINTSGSSYIGFSLNTTGLTTDIGSLPISQRLTVGDDTGGAATAEVFTEVYLSVGDVIRLHGHNALAAAVTFSAFTASYQGGLKQVQTVAGQKITIPTSEVRFEGASSRGSVATTTVKFDSMTKLRGDAFTVVNTTADGTYVQMNKAGRLSVSVSMLITAGGSYLLVTKNQAILSAFPTTAEIMAGDVSPNTANYGAGASGTFDVAAGDIIRIYTNTAPSANAINMVHFAFQEQEIAVSVTNVLPQFSESDSYIRTTVVNGHGSTATAIRRFSNVTANMGSDITYVDSATAGASFTVRIPGIYHISYIDSFTAASQHAISLNQSNLTLGSSSLPANEALATITTGGASYEGNVSWSGYLNAGDIIRPCSNAGTTADGFITSFSMAKVGKPNVTGVDVTAYIEIPQPTYGDARWSGYNGVSTSGYSVFDTTDKMNGNNIFVADNTDGNGIRFLKKASITATLMKNSQVFNNSVHDGYIYLDNVIVAANRAGNGGSGNTDGITVTFSGIVESGQILRFAYSNTTPTYGDVFCKANVAAYALSDQILSETDTFSTDIDPLSYSNSYTLATLNTAPVGTFITFNGGASAQPITQTTTAPTQSTTAMNSAGILITAKPYTVAGSANTPSRFAIQIGKGMKGVSPVIYVGAGKTGESVDFGFFTNGSTVESGAVWGYNESTGVLDISAGFAFFSNSTRYLGSTPASANPTAGYLVINASKNPALVGLNNNLIAARGVSSSGQSIPTSTPTVITYDTAESYDTAGSLNSATGVFTAPESGVFKVNGGYLYASNSWVAGTFADIYLYKNGSPYSHARTLVSGAVNTNVGVVISDDIYLSKGDTITLLAYHQRGAATTLFASVNWNWFSVTKA